MTLTTPQMFDPKPKERRGHERVKIALPGRYMLSDHREHPCRTINVSPLGLAIQGQPRGLIGERVVLYIDQIGRLEGLIARNFEASFAVKLEITPAKSRKLAETLAWLVSHQADRIADNRQHPRIKPLRRGATLTTPDGTQYRATLVDLSIHGAAINVDTAPPIGSLVTIGQTSARVTRHFDKGIAVEFERQLSVAAFDADAIGGEAKTP
jgi:PilZ domain